MDKDKIAIIIHTFLRDKLLHRCVSSVKKYLKNYRLYISDAGYMTPSKKLFYKELKSKGHKILRLPFDTYLTIARNKLVKMVKENYILYLDDDYIIYSETNLRVLKVILDSNKKIGLVGSAIKQDNKILNYNFNVIGKVGKLKYVRSYFNEFRKIGIYKYRYDDIIPNCFLARKIIFKKDLWDNTLNLDGSHSDFFLNLKFNTKWKVAYTLDCIIGHNHIGSLEYQNKRNREKWYLRFLEKWNGGHIIEII